MERDDEATSLSSSSIRTPPFGPMTRNRSLATTTTAYKKANKVETGGEDAIISMYGCTLEKRDIDDDEEENKKTNKDSFRRDQLYGSSTRTMRSATTSTTTMRSISIANKFGSSTVRSNGNRLGWRRQQRAGTEVPSISKRNKQRRSSCDRSKQTINVEFIA